MISGRARPCEVVSGAGISALLRHPVVGTSVTRVSTAEYVSSGNSKEQVKKENILSSQFKTPTIHIDEDGADTETL